MHPFTFKLLKFTNKYIIDIIKTIQAKAISAKNNKLIPTIK